MLALAVGLKDGNPALFFSEAYTDSEPFSEIPTGTDGGGGVGSVAITVKTVGAVRYVNLSTGGMEMFAAKFPQPIREPAAAIAGRLRWPTGVALDGNRNLYIADAWTNRIRKVSAQGQITTIAGPGQGCWGLFFDEPPTPPALSASLKQPWGLAAEPNGQSVYFADRGNNLVRRVSNGVVSTVVGAGLLANLNSPKGVAVDTSSGNHWLYVADTGNARVLKVDLIASTLTVVSPPGGSWIPNGVAVDDQGTLFVADRQNSRIVIQPVTGLSSSFATASAPIAVAVGPPDTFYFLDVSGQVSQVANGVQTTLSGQPTRGFDGDGGPVTDALLNVPLGLAADKDGNVFIADTFNNRIRRIDPCVVSLPGSFFPGSGGNGTVAVNMKAGCQWTATSSVPWITITGGESGTGTGAVQTVQYTVGPHKSCSAPIRTGVISVNSVQSLITQSVLHVRLGVFRGGWWYLDTNRSGWWDPGTDQRFGPLGTSGDQPFYQLWSYTSSNQQRPAYFRQGNWVSPYFNSPNNSYGASYHQPVVGSWTATGKSLAGILWPATGQWILDSNANFVVNPQDIHINGFGQSGDQPVSGDWDGTGAVRIGLFRPSPSPGKWILRTTSLTSSGLVTYKTIQNFGQAGDRAVVGDWNGTGKTKIGVFRNGVWYLDCLGTGQWNYPLTYEFGANGDSPFVAK